MVGGDAGAVVGHVEARVEAADGHGHVGAGLLSKVSAAMLMSIFVLLGRWTVG